MTPLVFDDVLADPLAYRALCLAMPRQDHDMLGVVWRGYSKAPDRSLPAWIESRYPTLTVVTNLTRLSPLGQETPNYVHTDTDMGDVTGIFYLNPDPPIDDGTVFYRHRETGRDVSVATDAIDRIEEGFAWRDLANWRRMSIVPARFNRLVLFPAGAYHSRAILENYGDTDEQARLIQICFCVGHL